MAISGGSVLNENYTPKRVSFGRTSTAKILDGRNSNPVMDQSGRRYFNDVNTGWWAANGTVSDILALWGMGYLLGSHQTDVFVLSLTYDKSKASAPVLATTDGNGRWVKAIDENLGGSTTFVKGPWKSGYALGTHGVDAEKGVVWAVLNYNGYFAAVDGI